MSNAEGMTKSESRSAIGEETFWGIDGTPVAREDPPTLRVYDLVIRASGLFRHLSFVIRHFALTMSILAVASCNKIDWSQNTHVDPNGPVEVVIPEHGAYTGAFIDFGEEEDTVNLE